jgi:hypothetical protein
MGKINWNTDEYVEGRRFLGRVEAAEWKASDYGGEQLEVRIKPLDHTAGGKTGLYHEWVGETSKKNSKMFHWVDALKVKCKLNLTGDGTEIVGHIFVWDEVVLPFKVKDKETKEEKEIKMLLPTEYYGTSDDEALAKWKATGGKAPVVAKSLAPVGPKPLTQSSAPKPLGGMKVTSPTPAAPTPADWSTLTELLKNGTNKAGLKRWAQRNGVDEASLNAKLTELDESGKLGKDEEGGFVLNEG